MKYLQPGGFTLPASNGKMSDLDYALAVGAIRPEEHERLVKLKKEKERASRIEGSESFVRNRGETSREVTRGE